MARPGVDPLFVGLLDTAFEHLAGAAPTALKSAEPDAGVDSYDFPFRWKYQEVGSSAELPGAATQLLTQGPALLVPPWGKRPEGCDRRTRNEHEAALLDCIPAGPDSLLAALVPASTLTSHGSRHVREALATRWQPVLVLYARGVLPGIHFSTVVATMFLRARQDKVPPLRLFQMPARSDEAAVDADFRRLLAKNGGRGRFGYVLRDAPPAGDSLAFERHDPKVLARRADLSGFGAAVTVDEVFDLPGPSFHLVADKDRECGNGEPGAARVVTGRDLKRDGTIAPPDEETRWAAIPLDLQLQVGDILLREIFQATDHGGLVTAEVTEEYLPAVASNSVVVLRAKTLLEAPQRSLILQFLRSPLARTLAAAAVGGGSRLNRTALKELHLPQPDEALSAALNDLTEAVERFEVWRSEAEELLQSVFLDDSAKAARARIVRSGLTLRLRKEAASLLDDDGYIVRTRFPYPVAYRWRGMEANVSAGADSQAYDAVLDTAEVLLCYAAHLALVFAREAAIEVGYVKNIRETLKAGKGPGFGDWAAVLEEVRGGRAFRSLPDTQPLNDLRSLLAGPEVDAARRRLNNRRNDQAHQRRVDSIDLPQALDAAQADLTMLVKSASVLSDLPLVHITAVRWDSLRRRATIDYRELMGDHPMVPTRTMEHTTNDLEVGSLYVMDNQRQLHLLRPFLTGRDCPTCRNWSTFHVDKPDNGTVTLKSLEHGHTLKDPSLAQPLRHVGLL